MIEFVKKNANVLIIGLLFGLAVSAFVKEILDFILKLAIILQ